MWWTDRVLRRVLGVLVLVNVALCIGCIHALIELREVVRQCAQL